MSDSVITPETSSTPVTVEDSVVSGTPQAGQSVSSTEIAGAAPALRQPSRKERVGEVVSNKMTKTIVVKVTRRVPHPKFKKIVRVSSKFYAHDEKAEAKVGDTVRIEETRPLSRLKRWTLVEIVKH